MVLNMYALKDEVDQFDAPMLLPNDAAAMRALRNAYDRPGSIYQTAPQDYTLYFIGQFDTVTGEILPLGLKRVCSCSDFRMV